MYPRTAEVQSWWNVLPNLKTILLHQKEVKAVEAKREERHAPHHAPERRSHAEAGTHSQMKLDEVMSGKSQIADGIR